MSVKNANCDGEHCIAESEVRVLPHSDDPHGGNSILCRTCFNREIAFRRERNKTLDPSVRFKLPQWEDLRVYNPGQSYTPPSPSIN